MHPWSSPEIIAGKDLQAGGTWLGVSQKIKSANSECGHIKFSALTNYRMIAQSAEQKECDVDNKNEPAIKPSRGQLVVESLQKSAKEMSQQLILTHSTYEGFNLIFGQLSASNPQLYCFDSINKKQILLSSGIHSICNGALDDIWPKMAQGELLLKNYIKESEHISRVDLMNLMKNSDIAPDELLPSTGLPLEWEQRLSAIFITSPEYGTRSTTILLMDNQGEVNITQQEYNISGMPESKAHVKL